MPMASLGCAVQIHEENTADHLGHPTPSVGGIWELPLINISDTMYDSEKQIP